MSGSPRIITVRQHRDATPDATRDARANAWAFVFDRYQKKAAGTRGGEDDPKGVKHDRARRIVQQVD